MFKSFKNYWNQLLTSSQAGKPSIVTFTGGMGAQMISAAIYFQMQFDGREVYADLSYFDKPKDIATEGDKGRPTHWGWQLEQFNLQIESFANAKLLVSRQADVIEDGALKLQLGLAALRQVNIQSLFSLHQANVAHLLGGGEDKYLCIHVRRGDYLNVASHLISDDVFIRLAKRFVDLINHVVIVSDSEITGDLRVRLSSLFAKTTFLDHINEYEAHCVMRGAHIFIGSNSQFSLIAAILNTKGLVLLPRTWFGNEQPDLEILVSTLGDFQVINDVA